MSQISQLDFRGNIQVQTMQRQSGIFIADHNSSVGWSAHGKTNSVFGSVSGDGNFLLKNFMLLNDPDLVDTPIDDRDVHISAEHSGENHATHISLDQINIETLTQNSSVFVGKSTITGMDANEKNNCAHGVIYGNKNWPHTISITIMTGI